MKKKIILLFIFLPLYAKCQVPCDSININAKVITELSKPLTAAIDRHIKVSKAKRSKDKDDFFVLISISPGLTEWEVPEYIIDSIYAVNDLKTEFSPDTLMPEYKFLIVLASKKYLTEGWRAIYWKNNYYFKYNNFDVLINSNLNLIFENDNQSKQIRQKLICLDKHKVFPYTIWTRYSMYNNKYVIEVRYKHLIAPNWTAKFDEFK